MENTNLSNTQSPYIDTDIGQASERLAQALVALEDKFKALTGQSDPDLIPHDSAMVEALSQAKARERELKLAADRAYDALGQAASRIRKLVLSTEAG